MSIREVLRDEATREATIQDLVQLVMIQPKIPADDPRVETHETHDQFLGNFFMRFLETRDVVTGQAGEQEERRIQGYKDKLGINLPDFFATYPGLCNAICAAIDAKEPYDTILGCYVELIELEQAGELPEDGSEVLNEAAHHSLGIEAIGHYYWDRINPLLAQAYGHLEAISPQASELG